GAHIRHQVDHPRPAARIAIRSDHALGFVDCIIDALAKGKRLAINADFLSFRLDARAQLGDDLAIDLDASAGYEFLTLTAAAEAGGGQDLLQAFAGGVFADGGRRGGPRLAFESTRPTPYAGF